MPQRLPRLLDLPVLLRPFTDADVPLILDVSADPIIPLITTVPTAPQPELALALYRAPARSLGQRGGLLPSRSPTLAMISKSRTHVPMETRTWWA